MLIRPNKPPQLLRLTFGLATICFLLIFPARSSAQLSAFAGGTYSTVRNSAPIDSKTSVLGRQLGVSLRYYPVKSWEKLSFVNELTLVEKGYRQQLDYDYKFRFTYLSVPLLADYELTNQISAQGGIELSRLLWTNISEGTSTFNRFDTGLIIGLVGFSNKRISLYARYTYGLVKMLDYEPIDNWGNFGSEHHDFRNSCLAVGIQFKLHHEKIRFYH